MARIRTIKPEFWKHEELSALPEATHMLAAALLNYADDEGYFNANPKLVQAECCPLREPSVSVHDSLDDLSRVGFIHLCDGTDGKRYGHIVNFLSHQRINRPTASKIKDLLLVSEGAVTPHTQFSEGSPPEGNREQGTGNGMERAAPASPDRYAFSGKVVRLTEADFDRWLGSFARGDANLLRSWLQQRDDYLASPEGADTRPRWFLSTSNWLAKKAKEPVTDPLDIPGFLRRGPSGNGTAELTVDRYLAMTTEQRLKLLTADQRIAMNRQLTPEQKAQLEAAHA